MDGATWRLEDAESKHPTLRGLAKRYTLWKEHPDSRNLWDIVLCCEDGASVHASRADLASWSEYFERLFLGSFGDSGTGTVLLKGVSGSALTTIIDSMYSCTVLNLSKDVVMSILETADMLRFADVTVQCEKFLAANIDCSNAVQCLVLADKRSLHNLRQSAESYICEHLLDCFDSCTTTDVANLQPQHVLQILEQCNPKWRRGVHLLTLFKRLQSPGITLQQLFDLIRLDECSALQLNELRCHELVKADLKLLNNITAAALCSLKSQEILAPTWILPTLRHLRDPGFKVGACWRLTSWSVKRNLEGCISSPPFAIPGKGKWKFELYPQGYGEGTGTHLSLYIVNQPGVSAAPLELTHKLWLLNLSEKQSTQDTVQDGGTTRFDAPLTYWGFDDFMSLDELEAREAIWITDDSLVFAVTYKP